MQNTVLPETKKLSLDVGTRMLVVGANEAGIAKFRVAGQERYEFIDVGSVKKASELPGKNYAFVVANGRIPEDAMARLQILADRAKVPTMYLTANGASLQRMMESFPLSGKGVLSFEVPEVVQTIELNAPNPTRTSQAPPAPTEPDLPNPPPAPPPPPPPNPPADNPPAQSFEQVLKGFEALYDQFGGDHKKITTHLRSLGVDKEWITDTAVYQRCLATRGRRKKVGATVQVSLPAELLISEKWQALQVALEDFQACQLRVTQLVTEVARENKHLQDVVRRQTELLKDLPDLQAEVSSLREKAEQARRLFAGEVGA